jgi:hypothetical protein
MSPDKQRIAIAEACGWTDFWAGEETGTNGQDPAGLQAQLPDYLNDLNAMHEAEKVLESDIPKFSAYLSILQYLSPIPVRATAAQRAQAFLLTIGKWEDEQ